MIENYTIQNLQSEIGYGGDWSITNGAAGGPSMVKIPGGEGMLSNTRTNGRPPTLTPLLAIGPMTSGYGKPHTELIIKHSEPVVASGIPLAVITGGKIPTIVPVSGGPEAPGVTTTVQPIVTGDPGIHSPSADKPQPKWNF
jgi:hypothetical protein